MEVNVGQVDRAVRGGLGVVLLLLVLFGGWGWIAALGGVALIASAAFRFCPAYRLLGIRTCPIDGK